jgi:uracil-DNA glycosylase
MFWQKSKLGDWGDILSPILTSTRFTELRAEINKDVSKGVYPNPEDAFKAFELCQLEDLKVVILGQEPYANGQSNGLAFGVNNSVVTPSLKIIRRELQAQFDHVPEEFDNSLEHWAKQGVLLLNSSFSVVKDEPASHLHIWKWFTPMVLTAICAAKKGLIFVLWGSYAQKHEKFLQHHLKCFKAAYPASELYAGGKAGFFGNGHFLKINELLDEPINWFQITKQLTDEQQIKIYE